MNMINNGVSKCKNCMVLLRIISLEGLKHNIRIKALHVKSKDNFLADSLSRFKFDEFFADVRRLERDLQPMPEFIPDALWPIQKIWKN